MNFVGRSFTKYDSAKNSISLSIRSNILGTAFKIFKASNTCCRPAPSHPLWSWGSWRQVKLIWPWAPRWAPTFSTSWSLGDRWTLVTCGENLGLLENSWDNFNRNALPIYIIIYTYTYLYIYIYIFDGQNSQNHGFRWRFLENQSIDQRKKEPRRGLQNARWAYQFRGWSSMQSSRVAMVGQGWRFGALATHRLGLAFWKKIYGYIRVKKVKSQSTWLYRKIGFLWKYGHIVKSNLGVCNTNPYLGGHFWVFFSPFSNTPICINHFCYICVELLG